MPRTPDRKPGAMIEDEEIRFISNSSSPTIPGAFNYNGTEFVMRDAVGTFNPRSSAGAFTLSGSTLSTEFSASFLSDLSASGAISASSISSIYASIGSLTVTTLGVESVEVTGRITASGITGSLTRLSNGSSYLIAGSEITITTGSIGEVTIAAARKIPVITSGSASPSGGLSGDIYLQYT